MDFDLTVGIVAGLVVAVVLLYQRVGKLEHAVRQLLNRPEKR